MLLFCTKLHSHTCQKWPAIESEWGRMKVRETTSVQENFVLANIKALDLCVCGCIYTHAISHTHTHLCIQTIVSITPISSYTELHLVIWQTLLSKATYNWGVHKAIHLEEAIRQRKCS